MFRAALGIFFLETFAFQVVVTAEVCSGQFLKGIFLKTCALQEVLTAEVCSGQFLKGFL